jgi:hypothetical protein
MVMRRDGDSGAKLRRDALLTAGAGKKKLELFFYFFLVEKLELFLVAVKKKRSDKR